MRKYSVLLAGSALLAVTALSGCAGQNIAAAVQAMAQDHADACVSVSNAFPPYSGTATVCRSNAENGDSVSVDKNGVMSMSRNPAPAAK